MHLQGEKNIGTSKYLEKYRFYRKLFQIKVAEFRNPRCPIDG